MDRNFNTSQDSRLPTKLTTRVFFAGLPQWFFLFGAGFNIMSGWIKIYREITRHWIWDNPSYFKAWISILLTVNHDDNKVLINGEVIECNRGQSLYSLEGWVKVFGKGWTRQKVRTFFNLLKSDEMIEIKGLRKTTQLTVCNYDKYQNMQHTLNTQNTDNNQIDINKRNSKPYVRKIAGGFRWFNADDVEKYKNLIN